MARKSARMKSLIEKLARKAKVDLTESGAGFKVENSPYMPLVIQNVGPNQIAVHHFYTQNGDIIFDPEIVFLVGCDDEWYPYQIEHPQMMLMGRHVGGIKRYAELSLEDARRGTFTAVRPKGQADLASFANLWSTNLRRQGFDKVTDFHIYD